MREFCLYACARPASSFGLESWEAIVEEENREKDMVEVGK